MRRRRIERKKPAALRVEPTSEREMVREKRLTENSRNALYEWHRARAVRPRRGPFTGRCLGMPRDNVGVYRSDKRDILPRANRAWAFRAARRGTRVGGARNVRRECAFADRPPLIAFATIQRQLLPIGDDETRVTRD